MRNHAAKPHRMHVNTLNFTATRPQRITLGSIRADPTSRFFSRSRNPACCVSGCSRGGIDLIGVVNLDNLNRFKIRRCLSGKFRRQNGSQRKIRGDQHTHLRVLIKKLTQGFHTFFGPAGSTHNGMHSVLYGKTDVRLGSGRHGQINHNLSIGFNELFKRVFTP